MPDLFDPLQLGAIRAANRVFMAPLTRQRATRSHVPTPLMAEYYAQRATAGLIIAEASGVSQAGWSWPTGPGLWTDEQVDGWKLVTSAVHERGGKIVAQILHMGRLTHSSVTGVQPVSSSETTAPLELHTISGKQPAERARALDTDGIARIVHEHGTAACNALAAGFDGVQVHAANGYLIDEFLKNNCNFRTDEYDGSPGNRIRFLREITDCVIAEIGAGRTSVRLSPNGGIQGCMDSAPEQVFIPAAAMLSKLGIGFLEVRELRPEGTFRTSDQPPLHTKIRKVFTGPLVLNQDYSRVQAMQAVASGMADAISFGRPFISNPDLPSRFRNDLSLAPDDVKTWYTGEVTGYTDYPAASEG